MAGRDYPTVSAQCYRDVGPRLTVVRARYKKADISVAVATPRFQSRISNGMFSLSAIFEFKIMLSALVRAFEFEESSADIDLKSVITLQPLLKGRMEEGVQLPLKVRVVDM